MHRFTLMPELNTNKRSISFKKYTKFYNKSCDDTRTNKKKYINNRN